MTEAMTTEGFAELCGKSCFSLLEGASQPDEVISQAKELRLSAIAMADRGGLYGSVRAHLAAKRLGQPYIVGAELPCERDAGSVVLLARDVEGYSNLCRLLTNAHAGRPREIAIVSLDDLGTFARGLVAIAKSFDERLLSVLRDAFGDWAYLATWRHFDGGDELRERHALAASRRFGIPMIATALPLYHDASRKRIADVLQCVRERTTLEEARARVSPNAEAHMRSAEQMYRLFRDDTERVARTVEIARECRFSLDELHYDFPTEALLPGETADEALRRLVENGKAIRYPDGVPPAVEAQIAKELDVIAKLDVARFFLATHEIVEIARSRRILCQGRGSAANSAVCFVLGITAVDPARSNLLFERFLSVERNEPPDIDMDFEHERREEVIQAIYEKYGRERAALVSEVISYRGRSALREAARVLGLSKEEGDRLAKTLGHYERIDERANRIAEALLDPDDPRVALAIEIAKGLQGLPRHLATHVGGFVLSAKPLHAIAPVEPAKMPGRTVLPWDKDDIEALGFFKVDVLGLGMLTAIRKTLALVHEETSPSQAFDPIEALARIPPENPLVYDAICRADTIGVFQIESRAQMAMLPRLRPRCFYDLVIEVAIVRPGPIQGGMVHPYLRRRNGEEAATMPHPMLTPILERTLGVPLFQEQVMQIAITGAGYSGGEADELRRDMAAWQKNSRLLRHRDRLLRGFAERGITKKFGEMLFEQIKGFGEYGFPESHAASFALLVYASAWLKVHHPAAFACALLNSQPMGFYSTSSIVRDAQAHGVRVLPIDIAHSHVDSTLEGGALRLGLREIKGLDRATAARIVEARELAPFSDMADLVHRASVRQDQLDVLAEAGALASLVGERRQAIWQARSPRVDGLFAGIEADEPKVELSPMPRLGQLALDYARSGLSLDDHPLCHLRDELAKEGVVVAEELASKMHGAAVKVAGVVLIRQRPATASGVVFLSIEDETGIVNLIVRPKIFEAFESIVRHASIVFAQGTIERTPRGPVRDPDQVPVIHVLVTELRQLEIPGLTTRSRDWG